MATLLGAGIPLLDALDTITRQHTGRFQQSILLLRDHVAAGGSLAGAMALQPGLFDDLCRNIVEVGENAGTLDVALGRLVEFRRRSAGLKNRVASTMLYPCIVIAVGLAVSMFLMTYVVPNLLGVLVDSGRPLPLATVVVKGLSDFLIGWWWALLIAVIGVGVGLGALLRSERGCMAWHRLQLRIPLVGDLVRKQAIARMSMVVATLLRSDVSFVRAVQIAQRTLGNRVLRQALEACEKAVYAGLDISVALEKTQAFPPLVIQVFAVGQASGRLEAMLESLAADYDTQVDITSGRLTALLEPVMMIALAFIVGFIAFATILPILEAGHVL
jgi:type II secretory pathway component PulF